MAASNFISAHLALWCVIFLTLLAVRECKVGNNEREHNITAIITGEVGNGSNKRSDVVGDESNMEGCRENNINGNIKWCCCDYACFDTYHQCLSNCNCLN
ncbi:unnamed protein product [Ilex paraguariensis]|uniref:Uncharacterized protein n=1 Tax=Ilex paraguariensis TaxID=185542 RepID=A0ABC8SSA1_9AQUA